MQIKLHAVLSKYSLTPLKGLNFEPIVYNTTSNAHTFEVANVGEFPFTFRLFPFGNTPHTTALQPSSKEAMGKGKGAPPMPNGLQAGPFFITPEKGSVDPGSAATVAVTFNSATQQTFRQVLGIDVQHRVHTDHPEGIPFELLAESCIPGIDCTKVQGIFEEHNICKELDPFSPSNNEYGISDKVRSCCFPQWALAKTVHRWPGWPRCLSRCQTCTLPAFFP
jgi:hydrocephalus-inducing protein